MVNENLYNLHITIRSPISTPEFSEIGDAIIFFWYPIHEGGRAVANTVFGDVNPSERLSITVSKISKSITRI